MSAQTKFEGHQIDFRLTPLDLAVHPRVSQVKFYDNLMRKAANKSRVKSKPGLPRFARFTDLNIRIKGEPTHSSSLR
jgi:hypothetical protein